MSDNPLINHFRKVEVYIPLPSKGKYYPEKLETSVDDEIGIYPMTVKDEIEIKSADSLYNGEALYHMISSCVPSIKDPKNMPVCDVDPILLGIRYASYGKEVDLNMTCQKCEALNQFSVSVQDMLGRLQPMEGNDTVTLEDKTIIHIVPYMLKHRVQTSVQNSKNRQLMSILNNANKSDEEKKEIYNRTIVEQSLLLTDLVSQCIKKVVLEDGTEVDNPLFIKEWVENINRKTYDILNDAIGKLSQTRVNKQVQGKCNSCGSDIHSSLEIDPFSFFT